MIRIYDRWHGKDKVVLSPGEYCVSSEDVVLYTVLGSCVAACLRDPVTGLAGMNHFMLPEPIRHGSMISTDPGRIGIHAMELLVNEMLKAGAARGSLVAKVFGGAHVLNTGKLRDRLPDSNVEVALEFLEMERIPVAAQDVGGQLGRKVAFVVSTGDVFVEKLKRIARPTLARKDEALGARVRRGDWDGQVTLFEEPGAGRRDK